uniref:Uncharacterized protein n=1 Tax=Rhizophora mucronata TaxID=61149 RepID=A0A2P2R130_RHIMU
MRELKVRRSHKQIDNMLHLPICSLIMKALFCYSFISSVHHIKSIILS